MRWTKKQIAEIGELKTQWYDFYSKITLSNEEMREALAGNLNPLERKKQKINTHKEECLSIRARAKQIIGKELTSYFFAIFEFMEIEDFKKYQRTEKRFSIRGYDKSVYSFVCHRKKPFFIAFLQYFNLQSPQH